MEQANELLLHFATTVRTNSFAGSHNSLLELGDNVVGRHTAGKQLFQYRFCFSFLRFFSGLFFGCNLFCLCFRKFLYCNLQSRFFAFQLFFQYADVIRQCSNLGFNLLLGSGLFSNNSCINNLDETSFVYVKGNFEPIVSEALWHECERIRKSRISSLRLPDGETRRKGARTTKNLWVSKLRCRCGSSYRIFNWRKLKDGTPVFGYQCNMRTVNPTRSFVLEHNMTQQLSCDAISIPEWKLELMAKKIFEKVWGNQNKAILRACKMIESCQNGKAATRMSAAPIQGQIEKIKKRKLNYAAMRADGELPREEYQALCKQADAEIARLEQELKALSPAPEPQTVSSDMKAIYDFLSQKVDVHGARLAPELIDQFVEVVTPIADYSYRWKLNTGCKKSKEERADLMAVSEKPILTFTIDFETAKRYREANKMPHQFRHAAWTDLTVEVYL